MSKSLKYLCQRELELQLELGSSKRADKLEHDGHAEKIHSRETFDTYRAEAVRFAAWCRETHPEARTLPEAQEHAREYITSRESVFSQHTTRSALARVFRTPGRDLVELPKRDPANITRGREMSDRQEAIERNHPELVTIARSCGLRNQKELQQLTADALRERDGELYLHVKGKGGRWRDAHVIGDDGRELLERLARERPEGRLVDVPSHANIHAYRADYAARAYDYAMEHDKGSGELYRLRDGSGRTYDKGALDYASQEIGHGSGRYYTIAYNYLSYGDSSK